MVKCENVEGGTGGQEYIYANIDNQVKIIHGKMSNNSYQMSTASNQKKQSLLLDQLKQSLKRSLLKT